MEAEMVVSGAIVDSWVEPADSPLDRSRLVLQVAPRGRPKDLVIVEAEPSLVPDRFWLEDLSENLCHGSPVQAVGRRLFNGFVSATRLQLCAKPGSRAMFPRDSRLAARAGRGRKSPGQNADRIGGRANCVGQASSYRSGAWADGLACNLQRADRQLLFEAGPVF